MARRFGTSSLDLIVIGLLAALVVCAAIPLVTYSPSGDTPAVVSPSASGE